MNLLPAFSVTGAASENIPSKWYPKTSLSSSKDLTYLGVSGDAKQTPPLANNSNPPCLPPPNERYIVDNKYDSSNPSPLGNLQRISAGPSEIVLPEELTREPKAAKVPLDDRKDLALGVYNMSLSAPVQVFVHRGASSIQGTSVGPGSYLTRPISGKKDVSEGNTMLCALCVADNAVVRLSSCQMMRTFRFQQGPIGLELEDLNDRVICHRVVPLSQAAVHRDALCGSEIVTVNGTRILSLDGFQQLLSESSTSEVTLKAIVTLPAEPKVRPVKEAKKKSIDPRLDKIGAAPLVIRAAEAKEAKGDSDSQPKDSVRGQEMEKAVSQVNGIYRDEDGNLVASVKHIRPSQDSKGYDREDDRGGEDADWDPEWEARAVGGALLAWNHITAVNIAEKEAEEEEEAVEEEDSLHVTCMPVEALMRSKRWGNPTCLLQISNLSADWSVSVFWVDEEGVLIFRKMLNTGDRHMEMTSHNHLWALCAVPASSPKHSPTVPLESSSLCLVRPSESSLLRAKCASLLWVPGRSLTASQRDLHPFDQLNKAKAPVPKKSAAEPLMHVQIL